MYPLCYDCIVEIMVCFVLSVLHCYQSVLLLSVKGLIDSNQLLCYLLYGVMYFCFLNAWLAECVVPHLHRIYSTTCIFGTTELSPYLITLQYLYLLAYCMVHCWRHIEIGVVVSPWLVCIWEYSHVN